MDFFETGEEREREHEERERERERERESEKKGRQREREVGREKGGERETETEREGEEKEKEKKSKPRDDEVARNQREASAKTECSLRLVSPVIAKELRLNAGAQRVTREEPRPKRGLRKGRGPPGRDLPPSAPPAGRSSGSLCFSTSATPRRRLRRSALCGGALIQGNGLGLGLGCSRPKTSAPRKTKFKEREKGERR